VMDLRALDFKKKAPDRSFNDRALRSSEKLLLFYSDFSPFFFIFLRRFLVSVSFVSSCDGKRPDVLSGSKATRCLTWQNRLWALIQDRNLRLNFSFFEMT
jgi:hypothetical protein